METKSYLLGKQLLAVKPVDFDKWGKPAKQINEIFIIYNNVMHVNNIFQLDA